MFVVKFEKDFSFASCLFANAISRSAWYICNGASHHITLAHEWFISLMDQVSEVHVELESCNSLEIKGMLYVPWLKKNQLSIPVMEDKGLSMKFHKGNALIRVKGSSPNTTQVIGVRKDNLYMLQGEIVQALVHSCDNLCELCHKRMWHLYYRVLPILRDTVIGLLYFNIEQQGCAKGPHLATCQGCFPKQRF